MRRLKKYGIVAMLLVCFLLTACNGAGTGTGGNNTANGTGNASENAASVMVRIEINPTFTLTLDKNNNIENVVPENIDAQKLFEELDVLNMSYEEGMSAILNKAYELEYIQADTAEVKMEIMFMGSREEVETEEFIKLLETPIEKFNEEKELAIEVGVPETMDGVKIEYKSALDGTRYETYYKNSKTIKEIQYGLDKYTYKEYNENNVMIKCIWIDESGYRCDEYDDNGTSTKMSWSNSATDGEEYYDEDGNRTMRKTWYHDTEMFGNSVYSEYTYWSNGNEKSHKEIYVDGRTLIETYDENGNCISSELKFPPDYVSVE